jgi:GH35 family endo-1,4-beta-xylanase
MRLGEQFRVIAVFLLDDLANPIGIAIAIQNNEFRTYRETVESLFNKVTVENRLKWKFYRDGDPLLEEAMKWFSERDLSVRGHCMVWPEWSRIPKELRHFSDNTNGFPSVIRTHVEKMAALYPDQIPEWDVANELYKEHAFMDLFGKQIVADWFHAAKRVRPDVKTYINDYAILAGNDHAHRQGYYEWIDYLLKQGAPLDGIGFQAHFRMPVAPEEIYRRLDEFAQFGLGMQVTEYDFDESDEDLQARFTRDFMITVFSHPQPVGIVTWCLWEDASWRPAAAFYASDWRKKPVARVWEELIKNEWHTEEDIRTGEDGRAVVRGFTGEYDVEVSYLSRSRSVSVDLTRGGRLLRIEL